MEEEEPDHHSALCGVPATPSVVSLSPFSPIPTPSSRRLSSHFAPTRVIPSARKLAWVSLQGRLVNAEESSSAKAIGGGFTREEKLGWELFSPIERFLIVAVIGVAVAESKKNRLISQLKKSVQLRDEVLSSMQQKLDDLCEQLNTIKRRPETNTLSNKNVQSISSDAFGCDKFNFIQCGCWHCDDHHNLFAGLMENSVVKVSKGEEELQFKVPFVTELDHDERRMSDLSDYWGSSVTSSVDFQMNISAVDHDICNLKRECEEKDATIKELTAILQSTNMASSKRNTELEDMIRRKNSMISKLKRDILVLEQKLVHFTRLQRPSSSVSIPESWERPLMVENIIYDMDSTSCPSSSDSDHSPTNRSLAPVAKNQTILVQQCTKNPSFSDSDNSNSNQLQFSSDQIQETLHHSSGNGPTRNQKSAPAKYLGSLESRPSSPLQEISTNEKPIRVSFFRSKQLPASGESRKFRRRTQIATNDAAPKKRWV